MFSTTGRRLPPLLLSLLLYGVVGLMTVSTRPGCGSITAYELKCWRSPCVGIHLLPKARYSAGELARAGKGAKASSAQKRRLGHELELPCVAADQEMVHEKSRNKSCMIRIAWLPQPRPLAR